jgi:hypothetical protein
MLAVDLTTTVLPLVILAVVALVDGTPPTSSTSAAPT